MIVDFVRGDIFESDCRHVAFGINVEGINDVGFAGSLAYRSWRELLDTGRQELGSVIQESIDGKTFYAIACHSHEQGGWSQTPETVEEALNGIQILNDEVIGVVLMGSGPTGAQEGADVYAILGGIARSNKRVTVFTLG